MCFASYDQSIPVISSLGRGPKTRWGDVIGDISNQSDIWNLINAKSSVSVSSTGTSTDEVKYITINGVESKLAGTGGGGGTVTPISTAFIRALV